MPTLQSSAEFFAAASAKFFEMVKSGEFSLVISPTLEDEIKGAPPKVVEFFGEIRKLAEVTQSTAEVYDLWQAYISHGILTPRWEADAVHVASATVARCKMIVSWNFRHIVNFRRIRLYNAVNRLLGYDDIAIYSPLEVVENE